MKVSCMHTVTVAELLTLESATLGPGRWHEVSQQQINQFADATGDHQWIHVDPERAATGPFGRTIAHWYLTLSLIPALLDELPQVHDAARAINYGLDKARFPAPAPVGSRFGSPQSSKRSNRCRRGSRSPSQPRSSVTLDPSRPALPGCSTAFTAQPSPPPGSANAAFWLAAKWFGLLSR